MSGEGEAVSDRIPLAVGVTDMLWAVPSRRLCPPAIEARAGHDVMTEIGENGDG